MRRWIGIVLALLATPGIARDLPPESRLAQVRAFLRVEGARLWPGYGQAPFEALLIRPDGETLFCRATLPTGFARGPRDKASGCVTATRARSDLPADALAAMPVFDLPATIVMGTPQETGRAEPDWVRTIIHEHFHTWQMGLPNYYARTRALGLAGSDGAMWMLNFPFPYREAGVADAYRTASLALADALAARGTPRFRDATQHFLAARTALATAAGARNWRYFDFELWQEGVARWDEIALGKRYPDAAVRASALATEGRVLNALREPDLTTQGRDAVYPYGAGEAMLLTACDPTWRRHYPQVLALGPLLDRCRA